MEVSTCKCDSEECCPHVRYWKGEITEDWTMRSVSLLMQVASLHNVLIYQFRIFNNGGDQRGLPPESSMSL